MFGPDAPPLEWDSERQYTRSSLEIYYFSHAAKALPLDKLTEVSPEKAELIKEVPTLISVITT